LANLSTIIFLKAKFTIGGRERNLAKKFKIFFKKVIIICWEIKNFKKSLGGLVPRVKKTPLHFCLC